MIQDQPDIPPAEAGPAETDGTTAVEQQPADRPSTLQSVIQGDGDPLFGGLLAAAGVALAVLITLNMARKARRRSAARNRATPRERLGTIRETAAREGAHELYAVRSAETARRYAALIDNKAQRLEDLIAEADALLERLERITQAAPNGRAPHATTASPPTPPPLPHTTIPDPSEQDPLKARVFDLADQGIDPIEIARRIGTHTGKVELILALRNATKA